MDERRLRVEKMLLDSMVRDWCSRMAKLLGGSFQTSFCSNSGIARFTSEAIEKAFAPKSAPVGCWRNGYLAFYEVIPGSDGLKVGLSVSKKGLNSEEKRVFGLLLEAMVGVSGGAGLLADNDAETVCSWTLIEGPYRPNDAITALDSFAKTELSAFEARMGDLFGNPHEGQHPDDDGGQVGLSDELLLEGALKSIMADVFERSSAARRKCLDFYGAKCAICGFDFGAFYGTELSGRIEVHHVVPLSEIREDHVVDPVRDLIPVCANCHLVLHSKPGGGAYLPEEVRERILR